MKQQHDNPIPRESWTLEDDKGEMYLFYFKRDDATLGYYMALEDSPEPYRLVRHTLH